VERHTEQMSESRVEGEYLRIWTWTEEWEDYQVCAAERVGEGDNFRLVYYSLKYIHRGPSWKTLGAWYLTDRIVSNRILEENIDK
jgi:hypothetical protein